MSIATTKSCSESGRGVARGCHAQAVSAGMPPVTAPDVGMLVKVCPRRCAAWAWHPCLGMAPGAGGPLEKLILSERNVK